MYAIKEFNIEDVPHHAIVLVMTSVCDYEADRTMFVENWPKWNEYTLISGYHCSCYGFNETRWDATVYDLYELAMLIPMWEARGAASESAIAPLIKSYFENIGKTLDVNVMKGE